MSDTFLFQALVYLLAAVITVPIAQRLGLGSVLGYLVAGAAIGPSALGLVGAVEDVQHFAEFGVVIMLFVVGLELRPSLLWRLRGPILGLGGAQVLGTGLVLAAVAVFLGRSWPVATTLGLTLAMSSTAIVIQSLSERGVLHTRGGQACFAVLLFQDVAVIPILAALPWLSRAAGGGPATAAAHTPIENLPQWAQTAVTLGAVATVVVVAHFGLRYVFRFVAASRLREMLTAVALLVVAGVAWLMHLVGLSAALGTFVAGVVLAESEYRHQLEADVEPFKGLLLGLFFIAVGAGLDLRYVASHPGPVAALVSGLVGLKFALLLGLGRMFRLGWPSTVLFACALAQGGEFCFVLLGMAGQIGLLDAAESGPVKAAIALSMALTPLLLLLNDRVLQPRLADPATKRQPDSVPDEGFPVVLAGFGRFGHVVGRLLRANGFGVTVLDNDPDQVEMLGRFGIKSYYGDATRLDLLAAAGAAQARLFICAVDDPARSLEIVDLVRREFPNLRILARAVSRAHAYDLLKRGVETFRRDTLGSAVDLGVDALRELGFHPYRAARAGRIFIEHDEASLRSMAPHYGTDDARYVSLARQHMTNLEAILRSDGQVAAGDRLDAWETAGPKTKG
ncbi:MAG: potassium transporter [Verrucomicrobia bacterium]|nr:MAG: potassium transporter [Verrucomicrobiota bacterium]